VGGTARCFSGTADRANHWRHAPARFRHAARPVITRTTTIVTLGSGGSRADPVSSRGVPGCL